MAINNNTKFPFINNFGILIIACFICGGWAVFLGKDLDFDLANYHFYNPYSFLHHRFSENYWPPSYMHVFFSPTLDLLSYGFINYLTPKMAVFFTGTLHGINLWLLLHIARYFLPKNRYTIIVAFVIAVMGMYGPLGLLGIGNFKNDHFISIFVLSFILLQLKLWKQYENTRKIPFFLLIISTLLLGISIGLKLTAMVFVVGYILALIFLPIQSIDKIKFLFASCVFVSLGMLLSSGYWMLILWQQYHNPFFPFLNYIFQSSDYPLVNFRYGDQIPQGIKAFLLYPFYYSFHGTMLDGFFRDFRFMLIYLLALLVGVKWIVQKLQRMNQQKLPLSISWIFLFFICTYLLGQYYLGTLRYLLPLEMLAPLMIYLLITLTIQVEYQFMILTSIYIFLIMAMLPARVGTRVPWYGQDYFNVVLPVVVKHTPQAMVLTPYTMYAKSNDPRPQIYLVPFLPEKWRFIGIPFHQEKYIQPNKRIMSKINHLIYDYQGSFYVLTVEKSIPELYRAAKQFHLKPSGKCEKIFSERQHLNRSNVLLCPMRKMS